MPPIAPTLRSLRHYALSGLGIVSLLLSAIIAIVSSIFGGGSDPIDTKANVVFTVVDQYGHGRRCLYQEKRRNPNRCGKIHQPQRRACLHHATRISADDHLHVW